MNANIGEEHTRSCVLWGDCIFDVVQKHTKNLEREWVKLSRPWWTLTSKAIQSGFLGMGDALVGRNWLVEILFDPPRRWPPGLNPEQQKLLKLAIMVSAYFPLYDQGESGTPQVPEESPDLTRQALANYAVLFKKKIFHPMWDAYLEATEEAAKELAPLCKDVYGESCTLQEAKLIFQGDLERALKEKTLDVSPKTYKVMPKFLALISV